MNRNIRNLVVLGLAIVTLLILPVMASAWWSMHNSYITGRYAVTGRTQCFQSSSFETGAFRALHRMRTPRLPRVPCFRYGRLTRA